MIGDWGASPECFGSASLRQPNSRELLLRDDGRIGDWAFHWRELGVKCDGEAVVLNFEF